MKEDSGYIDFEGNKLFYKTRGEGEPLVFLHGLGANHQQVLSSLNGLDGYQIITIDMPAHGESIYNPDNQELSFEYFTKCVECLLDHLSIEKCVMGGISMGAGITLRFVLSNPNRVTRMLLVRPSWLDKHKPSHLSIVADVGHWIEDHGLAEAESLLSKHPVYLENEATYPKSAASIKGLLTRPQVETGASVLYKLFDDRPIDYLDTLLGIEIKATVFTNDEDDLHPGSIGRKIFENLPNASLVHLPPRYGDPEKHRQALIEGILAI